MVRINSRKFLTGIILLIATVLFLTVNIISDTLFKSLRLDLTENKLYTLSSGTKEIIRDLQEPIILRLYFSKNLENINPYLLSFAARVEDLLRQYQRSSKGKVVVEIIDPEPFSKAEDEAVNNGLQGVPVDNAGTEFYLGLVGTDALNGKKIIPFLHPNREQNLEYDITQLIYNLANPKPRIVGVMSSLPLDGGVNGRPWAVWQQMQQLFNLEMVDYKSQEIPESINTLMIVEPSTFTNDALKAIDKFVMRGGHILAFIDPVSEVADRGLGSFKQKKSDNYLGLLKSWGIEFDDSKLVADRELAKMVKTSFEGREVNIRYPFWMDFTSSNFSKTDVLSSSLDRLTLATPGFIKHSLDAKTIFTPLITTSDQAMLVDSENLNEYQQNIGKFLNNFEATGKYTVAARIAGLVKSPYSDAHIPDTSIIVIADTDMLHDHFWLNVQNLMGQEFAMPSASNGNLVLSALDNLSGSNALIGIRNRDTFSRPFETVQALELKSQDKYRETEQQLQQKLQVTKQKLDQLESQKKDDNSMLLSVQQKKAEDAFRNELVETRRELRDVRRKLNYDIESVTTSIKFFTIGFIPLLIMLGGIVVWVLQLKREIRGRKVICSIPKH